jgi:ketosteroid isomerase-like protein
MSRENVEIARRLMRAFNEGDVEAIVAECDPDVEWEEQAIPGVDRVFRGHDGVRRWADLLGQGLSSLDVQEEALMEADDSVIASVRVEGEGTSSGVKVEMHVHLVATFRDGKLVRRQVFQRLDEALEAVWLPEWAMSRENVAAVLEATARYNEGARTAGTVFWHEDAEYQTAREDPESTIHQGIEAIRRQFDRWHEVYPDLFVAVQQVRASRDYVFLWVRVTGHAAASGIPIDMQMAQVYTMRDGRAARLVEYLDREEALEAVGLKE